MAYSYNTNSGRPKKLRRDIISAEPIRHHVWEWVNAQGGLRTNGYREEGHQPFSAIDILSNRLRVERSSVERFLRGMHGNMTFDRADRLLCAIGRPDLWLSDPELGAVYEQACQGADSVYPIADIAA